MARFFPNGGTPRNMALCQSCDEVLHYSYAEKTIIHETIRSFLVAVKDGCCICQELFCGLPEEWQQELRRRLELSEQPSKKRRKLESNWLTRFDGDLTFTGTRHGAFHLNLQMIGLNEEESLKNPCQHFIPVKTANEDDFRTAALLWTSTSTSTNSEETSTKIQAWLDRCENTHAKCRYRRQKAQKADPKWRPARLVEIKAEHGKVANASELTCRIVELKPEDSMSHDFKYVTLSHRWPDDQQIQQIQKLMKENLTQWKNALPVNKLRQIFQDAFVVAHRLDVSYVWVDTLCIVQNDAVDWNREAPMMHKVYSNAAFNICASRPNQNEKSESLFSSRVPPNFQSLPRKLFDQEDFEDPYDRPDDSGHYLIRKEPPIHIWDGVMRNSPLASRGWIFQEQLLSRANVHFGESEVIFECLEMRASESLGLDEDYERGWEDKREFLKQLLPIPIAEQGGPPVSDPPSYSERNEKGPYNYADWHDLLSRYSALQLTESSDRLVALSGVAQYFKELFSLAQGDTYIAGLWKSRLATELAWQMASATPRGVWKDSGSTHRHSSFSWVSVLGKIENKAVWPNRPDSGTYGHALVDVEIIQYRVSPNTTGTAVREEQPVMEDIFSLPSKQTIQLKLKGLLRPLTLRRNVDKTRPDGLFRPEPNSADLDLELELDGGWSDGCTRLDFEISLSHLEVLAHSGELFLMPLVRLLYSTWFLLLERVVEMDNEVNMGRFRRIGVHKEWTHSTKLDPLIKEFEESGDQSMRQEILRLSMMTQDKQEFPNLPVYTQKHDEDFSALPCWQYDESSKQHIIFIV
jgi:hypothetical protein